MIPANAKAPPPSLAKGTEVDLAIEKLAFGGKALGRVDGFVVFVEHAVPGQTVRVRITRKKRSSPKAGSYRSWRNPRRMRHLFVPISASAAVASGRIWPTRSNCTGSGST